MDPRLSNHPAELPAAAVASAPLGLGLAAVHLLQPVHNGCRVERQAQVSPAVHGEPIADNEDGVLYLLDTNLEVNHPDDRALTGDEAHRLTESGLHASVYDS